MIDLILPHGADPMLILSEAKADGIPAIDAGAYCTTRASDYVLSVPSTHEAAVSALIASPPQPLARDKSEALAGLANTRWQRTQTFTFDGVTTAADGATTAITGAIVGAREAMALGYMQPTDVSTWKLAPGVFVQLDFAGLVGLGFAIRAHIQACFDNEATLSAAIQAAATPEALGAVDISKGWPE